MRSRPAPSRNPTVLGDNASTARGLSVDSRGRVKLRHHRARSRGAGSLCRLPLRRFRQYGRLNVSTREEIVDSSGNKIEAGPMTIYEIEGSRIIESRSDDNCLFRDYGPLEPIKR
jgi:hypothetical protein